MGRLLTVFSDRQFQNIAVAHLCTIFGTNLLMPVLPVFLQSQGFSETKIGFIMGITAAGALFVRPWVGYNVDTKGSRPAILIGQILILLSTVGYLWASSFFSFFSLRLLYGIALAFYGTGAVTFASSIGTGETNASAIAFYTLMTMLGIGLSMGVAQVVYDSWGFAILVIGSLLFVSGAFGIMKLRAKPIVPSAKGKRVPFMDVLQSKVVVAAILAQFAASVSFSAVFTFIPLASLANGVSFYSLFFIAFAIFVVASRFFVQHVNGRLGLEKTAVYASIIMVCSISMLAWQISPVVLAVAGSLFGIGFGVVFPTLVLLVVRNMPDNCRGTALGILIAAGDIGVALAGALLGAVAEYLGYSTLFFTAALQLVICIWWFHYLLSHGEPLQEKVSSC